MPYRAPLPNLAALQAVASPAPAAAPLSVTAQGSLSLSPLSAANVSASIVPLGSVPPAPQSLVMPPLLTLAAAVAESSTSLPSGVGIAPSASQGVAAPIYVTLPGAVQAVSVPSPNASASMVSLGSVSPGPQGVSMTLLPMTATAGESAASLSQQGAGIASSALPGRLTSPSGPMQAVAVPLSLPQASSISMAADRVSLSQATVSAQADLSALSLKPSGQFVLDLIETLTGEPRSQLQWLGAGFPGTEVPDYTARAGPEALQVLVQGSVRSHDQQLINLMLRLTVTKLPGMPGSDPAIQEAVQQWAQNRILLEYPGNAADLAGYRLNFQAALDPRGMWPIQSFMMSGMLSLSIAAEEDAEDEWLFPEWEADNADDVPPKRHSKKPRPKAEDELSPLPADGGPPIISARRWLELELRYLRTQVRLWMGLPASYAYNL
jgi:hypothetical protein